MNKHDRSEWDKLSADMKADLLLNAIDSFSGRLNRIAAAQELMHERLAQIDARLQDKA